MENFDFKNQIIDRDSMSDEVHLVEASTGIRFANFIIDIIGRIAFEFGIGLVLGALALTSENGTESLGEFFAEGESSFSFTGLLFSVFAGIVYYSFFEYFTKGKTLGKILTRTRAVTEYGENLTFGQAVIRSLCRYIPFEPFSFFAASRGWHDTISNTMVIDERESRLPAEY
jgi:uncharacterized RDD family membrane protein YckC